MAGPDEAAAAGMVSSVGIRATCRATIGVGIDTPYHLNSMCRPFGPQHPSSLFEPRPYGHGYYLSGLRPSEARTTEDMTE